MRIRDFHGTTTFLFCCSINGALWVLLIKHCVQKAVLRGHPTVIVIHFRAPKIKHMIWIPGMRKHIKIAIPAYFVIIKVQHFLYDVHRFYYTLVRCNLWFACWPMGIIHFWRLKHLNFTCFTFFHAHLILFSMKNGNKYNLW